MKIQDLICGIHDCGCGKTHLCPMDAVEIGADALNKLPVLCQNYRRIVLVADDNTWSVCGKRVAGLLGDRVQNILILHAEGAVIPDEKAIDRVRGAADTDTDLYLGVGSGVINDLCKCVSFGLGLPYFIVATAPSMDGYASSGCALILGGMKVTVNARPPKAIIAEQSALQNAPMDMLRAGYGDIIGKFSCLNDWKLSALLNGDPFCQTVYDLVYNTAVRVKSLGAGIAGRDGTSVCALMEALVTVGIAMSYMGNSHPASGSEHHLSHFFEITGMLDQTPCLPHGINVAYSSVITARIRQKLLCLQPEKRDVDRACYEADIRRIYTVSAGGVLDLQKRVGAERGEIPLPEKWEEVKAILRECPAPEAFAEMLGTVGLTMDGFWGTYGRERVDDAILYAKDLKDHYTVLNLHYDYFRGNSSDIRLIVFDLDGTLTQHKTPLSPDNRAVLDALGKKYRLLMAGAGMCRRIFDQMGGYPIDISGNYGMQFAEYDPGSEDVIIRENLSVPCDRESVEARVTALREKYGYTEFSGDDVEYHASGCVTIPLLGTKARQEDKLAFDPDRKKRRAIYADVKRVFSDYNVFVGGSSSFDMAPAPYNKAYALKKYCAAHGISPDEVVFVGDDYGEGGNDESVYLSEFHFVKVDNYLDFPQVIKRAGLL